MYLMPTIPTKRHSLVSRFGGEQPKQTRSTKIEVEHLEIAIRKYPELREGLAWVREQLAR